MWQIQHDERAEFIADAKENNYPIPPKLGVIVVDKVQYSVFEPPLISREEMFYLQAFFDLDTERVVGTSIGPIPWRSIHDYGLANNLEPDVLKLFTFVIRRMDRAFIPIQAERLRNQLK